MDRLRAGNRHSSTEPTSTLAVALYSPGSPVAMDRPPVTADEHQVPCVPERVLANLHPGFVADSLRVSTDVHTRQTGVAEKTRLTKRKRYNFGDNIMFVDINKIRNIV